ncbi:MAG TPA: DMT family transporter [Burkholderiales bacterium]|nr:DMT family transporter [Burkholderiales bacterium]
MSAARWSLIAAIATMVVWGLNFPVVKYVLEAIGPGPFLFLRFLAMPLLGFTLLWVVFRRNPRQALPASEDWPRFAACGLLGHTAHVGIVTWGMHLSTPFSASLVLTSGPVFTLLILAWLGAEKLRPRQVAGTLAAFAGIVVFLSDKLARGVLGAGLGDLVLLFAASLFALYTVAVRPLAERYGPVIVLAWTLAFGAPPLVLLCLKSFIEADFAGLGAGVWLALLYGILVSNFLGWLVWTWVNAARGVARSAPLQYLMPPISGFAAWLTLGEVFTGLKIAGALLALAGVAWAQFSAGPPRKEAAQTDAG